MTKLRALEAQTGSQREPSVDANRHQTLLAICSVTIALTAGACTGSVDTGTSVPPPDASTETSPHLSSTSTTTASTTSSLADLSEPVVVAAEVTLDDYAITPSDTSLRGEVITISVTNQGGAPHDLALIAAEVDAYDLPTAGIHLDESDPSITLVARTDLLNTDQKDDLVAALDPGLYILVCTVPHHYVRNQMVATLTVLAP